MRLLLMCDGQVGSSIADWLMERYFRDLGAVVTVTKNDTYIAARARGIPTFLYQSATQVIADLASLPRCNLGMLAWWPRLIPRELMAVTDHGFINTHPSLLPFSRGKHYNFWTLVEQSPFGVSLHYVDEGIDSGDIVAQLPVHYGWEDTGGTLYAKAGQAMIDLFKSAYPNIRTHELPRIKQDPSKGSLHFATEIDPASRIDLDKTYSARELINLIRARTFPGQPACWFDADGAKYEITLTIKRKTT
jgi:methionyl-tRNA formyltransferase